LDETCPSAASSTSNPTWPHPVRTLAATVGSPHLTAWTTARLIFSLISWIWKTEESLWYHVAVCVYDSVCSSVTVSPP
jgi:hypothetical protein